MTEPKQAKATKRGRTYAWPPTEPHEFEFLSVTTILGAADEKPWMAPWRVKMVAEYAVEKVDSWIHLARGDAEDKEDAVRQLKSKQWGRPNRINKFKAKIGTVAHKAADRYAAGDQMSTEEISAMLTDQKVPGEFHSNAFGYCRAAYKFLDEEKPEIVYREATVYSRTHEYAGTLDMQAKVLIGNGRELAVVDYKTSASIYNDVALQIVGYSRADFMGMDDGTEVPLEPTRFGVVVQLKDDGNYEKHVFVLSDELFDVFLAKVAVANAKLDVRLDEDHVKDVLRRCRRPS